MDFDLSDDEREIQSTARELLAARATPAKVRAAAEGRSEDATLWREVAELGWPGIAIAEEHGGQGLGLVELCVVLEQAGGALAPIPLLPSVGAALLIERGGSAEQRERVLPALASGQARGAFGSCGGGGALIAGPADAEAIVLVEGEVARVLDAGDPSLRPLESIDPLRGYLTLIRPERGSSGNSGEAAGGAQLTDAADAAGDATLPGDAGAAVGDAVPAGGEQLRGDVDDAALTVAVAVAAESVGVCDRALEMTLTYVKDRRQFDMPVGAFQAVSHRCAEMLLATEQARSAVYQAAWAADADPALLPAAASLAKALASEAVTSVTASAIQAHGGIGFTWEADVHWLYKRAQMNAALLGGAAEHRRKLAAAIGLVSR